MSEETFFYVKLSCPKDDSDQSFKTLLKNTIKKDITDNFTLSNIPNNLLTAKCGDIIFLQFGGDKTHKRSYFRDTPELIDFENGIYAIASLISTNPSDKKVSVKVFPLKNNITKMDLYIFPQFLDNLGCATKGIPNQAGLYELEKNQGDSLIEFLQSLDYLGKASELIKGGNYANSLSDGIDTFIRKNPAFTQRKSNQLLADHIKGSVGSEGRKTLSKGVNHCLSKPFILLAGISGTGKTRFVRKQAESIGSLEENYQLVSVRPDWHEPSDLLGYISRLNTNGAEFIVTDVVKFMVKAWLSTLDHIPETDVGGKKVYSPIYKNATDVKPYWLCLDEMNLAPVEQYFADYLSVLETRKWEDGSYSCDALLSKNIFSQLEVYGLVKLRKDLGLSGGQFDNVWEYFKQNGICIPFNLIVAGTVNMDETTHGFSRKVIDRALTFDFGEFFPNDYDSYFDQKSKPKKLSFSDVTTITEPSQLKMVKADSDGSKSIDFLNEVNNKLKGTPFELAYRALNELLVSVYCFSPKSPAELQAVWDDFLMCKVLPRIEGDEDKLLIAGHNILEELETLLKTQVSEIWEDGKERLDLLSETTDGKGEVMVTCRSRVKLKQMQDKLATAGFTSYWP